MRVIVGLIVCMSLLVACASGAIHTVAGSDPVELTLSETAKKAKIRVDERRYTITLEQIMDSRCPANAKCLWAGELAAEISLERTDMQTPRQGFTLGEESAPSIEIKGLRFELVSISETDVTFAVRVVE